MILRNVKFDFKVTKGKDYKRYIQGYKAAMVALNALDKEDDEYLIKFNEILDDFFADLLGDDYDQRLGIDVDDLEDLMQLLADFNAAANPEALERMAALADANHLIMAEAMTIWHMPLYKKLWEIVQSGALGKVQIMTLNFGSYKEYNMQNRFFNMNLAGGAMLDIGVYALSIVRSFMEETPTNILSQWKPSPTGSDEQATVLLQNSLGQMATVALSMHSKQPKRAMISCEKGYIEIMEYPRADKAVIVDAETGARTEVAAGSTADALYYEMLDMEHAVQTRDASAMCLGYSRDVMDIMTRLRKEWGMKYPGEEWD